MYPTRAGLNILCPNPPNIIFAIITYVILMTIILSIVGQLGDLVFSAIKRYYGKKDFSNIMPGHGGILDRFDSLTFIVFGYVIIMVLLKAFM